MAPFCIFHPEFFFFFLAFLRFWSLWMALFSLKLMDAPFTLWGYPQATFSHFWSLWMAPFFEAYGWSLFILGLSISYIFEACGCPFFWNLWMVPFYFWTIHNLHFHMLKIMDAPCLSLWMLPFYFGTIHKLHFRIFEAYGWPPFLKLMDGPFLFWDYS